MTVVDETSVEAKKPDENALLSVTDLRKYFLVKRGIIFQKQVGAVKAVDGLSFDVAKGETLGVVGRPAAASPRWGGS